jgi:hypothetical protein
MDVIFGVGILYSNRMPVLKLFSIMAGFYRSGGKVLTPFVGKATIGKVARVSNE